MAGEAEQLMLVRINGNAESPDLGDFSKRNTDFYLTKGFY